jgi:hypothetical protein
VAGSPALANQSSSLSAKEERFQRLVAEAVAKGYTASQIANRLANGDVKKYRHYYGRVKRMIQRDPLFRARMADYAMGEYVMGIVPTAQAISRRAARGRMDAARFLMAATGVYNEKVQHEHSGEVQVTLAINRPAQVEDRTKRMDLEEGIVDAEVVEDS